jgi:S1-C subfamily serine protease
VRRSLDELRERGEVRYAYLGVSTTPVYPQLSERFKLGVEDGAWIQEIVPDGPADDADLKSGDGDVQFQARPFKPGGDVIVRVGEREVHTENDLGIALQRFRPGEEVELQIIRDGERRTVTVKLGERPAEVDTTP